MIVIGSNNRVKTAAVEEVVTDYPLLRDRKTVCAGVPSGVREQPLSFEETVRGARNRAEGAYRKGSDNDVIGVGLEGGLMHLPGTTDEYIDVCVCAVYDGASFHIGTSCGFRLPRQVSRLMFEKKFDLEQALNEAGLTEDEQIGSGQGAVGLLTNGRVDRKDHCKQSLITALISLENSDLYTVEATKAGGQLGRRVEEWTPCELPQGTEMIGQSCVVEPLDVAGHAEVLFQEYQLDGEGTDWTYLPFGPFFEYTAFVSWLTEEAKHKQFYVIMEKGSDKPQGLASYHDIDVEHGVIEIGSIIFGRTLQKTRAGTEAMYLLIRHAFDELGYRRCQWRCNALNVASRNAALRLGFTFEGIFHQAHVFKGRNRDTAWYSIVDCEWPGLKARLERWLEPSNFDATGAQKVRLGEIAQTDSMPPLCSIR